MTHHALISKSRHFGRYMPHVTIFLADAVVFSASCARMQMRRMRATRACIPESHDRWTGPQTTYHVVNCELWCHCECEVLLCCGFYLLFHSRKARIHIHVFFTSLARSVHDKISCQCHTSYAPKHPRDSSSSCMLPSWCTLKNRAWCCQKVFLVFFCMLSPSVLWMAACVQKPFQDIRTDIEHLHKFETMLKDPGSSNRTRVEWKALSLLLACNHPFASWTHWKRRESLKHVRWPCVIEVWSVIFGSYLPSSQSP